MGSKIKVLMVMPVERRLRLWKELEACGADVLVAGSCTEARRILGQKLSVQVIVADSNLPDGNWRGVIADAAQSRSNAQVIVCSRLGDHQFWIDALEGGAYDVLVEPYEMEEIRRILNSAAGKSEMHALASPPMTRAVRSPTGRTAAG